MSHKAFRCLASLTLALAISVAGFTPALAAPPSNDNFTDAIAVSALSYTDTQDTTEASVEAGEPASSCAYYGAPNSSIWYSFTPTSKGLIVASVPWANFTPMITAYTGNSLAGLTEVRCQTYNNQMTFEASAGVTYYFQIGNLYPSEPGGLMQFQLDEILPPANDDFSNAKLIDTTPFDETVTFNQATSKEQGEPLCADNGTPARTVWYSFTPAINGAASVSIPWAEFSPMLGVYTGTSLNNLTQIGCQFYTGSTFSFHIDAGTTYYIQVAKLNPWEWDGQVQFHLEVILPPANDSFINAKVITSLPFDDSMDIGSAGKETGEPKPSCASDSWDKTVWYAFTPTAGGSVTASIPWASFSPILAAYTGNSLTNLQEVECKTGSNLVFNAEIGMTYYFQVGTNWGEGRSVTFHLEVTPPPTTWFWFTPSDPSVFDTIQFNQSSYDPAGVGFKSFAWDFGDGTTSSEWYPTHKYAGDGDYTVQLIVTTHDGRTASASQVAPVRTHDVAVTKISAPQSANSGQTRSITVYVNNKKYGETVRVDLYKSGPYGFEWIGYYTQFVPVRPANRTTPFTFNYTFTSNDAKIGKVTFKATVGIIDARDAWLADNELISSPPTKVPR